jgi:hypothetical protein
MATFADLYATLLDYELGTNDSAILFLTARRKACVNEGLREFADLTDCWQRESTIAIVNGQTVYNLNSTTVVPDGDFVRITADGPSYRYVDASSNVQVRAGDEFPRRDVPWLNSIVPGWPESTGATHPESWYLGSQDGQLNLGLYPPASVSTDSTAALVVPYVARPSSLTADTSVPFTDTAGIARGDLRPYHQAAVHYAAHKLELLRKDTQASDRQMQKFLGYVQKFLQQRRKPAGDTIRPARSYFTRASARAAADVGSLRAPWWR